MALNKKQRRAASTATQGLYDALTKRGIDSVLAQRVAAGLLQRPGVVIGANGRIKYKGKYYQPAAFADTNLAKLLTGETAIAKNTAVIKGDPGYLQAKAQLDMERQQNLALLDQQRQRGILDYGSGAYTTDPLLRAQAEANPFSITKLLAQQYARAQGQVGTAANRAGTLFGGGLASGLGEAGRVNAQQVTDANRALVDLLSNLNTQQGGQEQAYGLGLSAATLDAQQRLLAAGLLHAAKPPAYTPTGHYHFSINPPVRRGEGGHGLPPPGRWRNWGGGGGRHIPPPPGRGWGGGGGGIPPPPGRRRYPPPPPRFY